MQGKLYLVATPIGNLEDITLRALQILKQVDLIAAEDTRHTLKILNHFKITKPLISYHRHSGKIKTEQLIEKLKEGKAIALMSDAGTPGICDPGEEIVKKALEKQIEIIPIPGACAAINALIVSGLNTKEFNFLGFLPLNKKLRKQKLEEIQKANKTVILYEAPHKLEQTLKDLEGILEDRKIVLAKEITKIHESYYRGTTTQILAQIGTPKGEFVILIEQNDHLLKQEDLFSKMSVEEHYHYYETQGMEKKEIIKQIAKDRKLPKNEIYQKFLK